MSATAPTEEAHIFEHRSIIPATIDQVWAFHESPGVLSKLTPPPIFVQIVRDERKSLTSGQIAFKLWFGPLPVNWVARHEPGPIASSFVDRMLAGPAQVWVHEHIMQPVEGGTELLDRLTLVHKSGGFWSLFTRIFFGDLALRALFLYRHWRTNRAVTRDKR